MRFPAEEPVMTDTTVKARITGRVQGVSYRAWTRETALEYGLTGWVRNCADGSVEAVFSGPDERVKAMLTACLNGPTAAEVEDVRTEAADWSGEGFEIRR
jgi:acylphosphatase